MGSAPHLSLEADALQWHQKGPWHYFKGCSERMSCLLSLNFTLLSPVRFGTSPSFCFKLLFFVFGTVAFNLIKKSASYCY